MRSTVLCLALLVAACDAAANRVDRRSPPPAESGSWRQWRGSEGLGVDDATPLPAAWSTASKNIRWRVPVESRGNSSPIAVGGRVFMTATRRVDKGRIERVVHGFDLATGAPLFTTGIFAQRRFKTHYQNTNAAPTPASDGRAVYVFFGSFLAAVDLDGNLLWSKEVDPLYAERSHWGAGSSPVLFEDLVILMQDNEEAQSGRRGWLAAFDTETGGQVWRTEWVDTCCSYSTPLVWKHAEEVDLVVAHSRRVSAYDPRTGALRWSHPYEINQPVASPTAADGVLCTLGGAHNVKGNACFRVTGSGGEARVERLWWDLKSPPEVSSPVYYGGKLYAVTVEGVMTCRDPRDGRVLWRDRLPGGMYHASLVAGDGKVYAHSTAGRTAVLDAAADELRLLAHNDLEDEKMNNSTPAIGGGCLVLRTNQYLHCIEAGSDDT